MKLYRGQTNFKLILQTGSVIVDVASAHIKFKKPDQTLGEWVAVVNVRNLEKTFTIDESGLESGKYTLWCHIVHTTGLVSISESASLTIHEPGE